jgi:lantibiotic modifying enzyme
MGGWCSGAPGIGLARLSAPGAPGDGHIRRDIDAALAFTTNPANLPGARDHLCCGLSGGVDFLLEAARARSEPSLLREAERRMAIMIARAAANGGYAFPVDDMGAVFSPGLFTGLSGVGYTALRLASAASRRCSCR